MTQFRNRWAALAALGAVALACSARAEAKCVLRQIGELPILGDRGVGAVDAEVNGKAVRLLIDTGSFATSLDRPTVDKLGLRVKPVQGLTAYGVGGSANVGEVGVKKFNVGPLSAAGINLPVIGEHDIGPFAGVLGIQFLRQADVEFDYPAKKLRFFKADGCSGDQVVYWGRSYSVLPIHSNDTLGQIEVDVKVAGQTIRAIMDTGADSSVVTPVIAQRWAIGVLTPTESSEGVGRRRVATSIATFPLFGFGDETIHNVRLDVTDLWREDREVGIGSRIATSTVDETEMLLGADFFRAHRVYVSKSQNKVYVSYVGGPVFNTRPPPTPKSTASTTP